MDFQRLGDVLQEVLQQFRQPADENLLRIWDLWDEAVGAVIAQHARPSAFKGDLLIVQVSNSTWIHHLQFLKPDILHKVNQALGHNQIADLRFKIGVLPAASVAKTHDRTSGRER